MGKASKRKASRRREEQLSPQDLLDLNPNVQELSYPELLTQVLSGEMLFCCGRMQDKSGHGGDILIPYKISELADKKTNLRSAYETAIQKNIINLGIRRQQEQGKGLLNLMDAQYRRLLGIHDSSNMGSLIFNWFTISELESQQRYSPLFVNTNSLKPIALTLAKKCDPVHEFPCLFSGVPLDEPEMLNGIVRCHLLFVVKDDNVPSFQMDIKMNEKFI